MLEETVLNPSGYTLDPQKLMHLTYNIAPQPASELGEIEKKTITSIK